MQNDEMIWNVINKHFCSFKKTTDKEDMCRNEYNVTGKCNRVSCPLANSNYGTVREHQGRLFLYLKTVERAHLPSRLWEKIKLSLDIKKTKQIIEKNMKNVYPKHQIERCKRRAIRLKQVIDRMRKLELKPKEKLEGVKKKTERREAAREKKALSAAHIEDVIEDELLRRLQQGVYGELYAEHRVTAEEPQKETETETPEKKAVTGSVRFEAAADDTASVSSVSSCVSSVSSCVSSVSFSVSSDSEAFSFTDSEAEKETDASLSPSLKQKKGDKKETDVEDIHFLGALKKRRQIAAEGDTAVPLATLRRQAAKRRRNARVRIEYEREGLAEEA